MASRATPTQLAPTFVFAGNRITRGAPWQREVVLQPLRLGTVRTCRTAPPGDNLNGLVSEHVADRWGSKRLNQQTPRSFKGTNGRYLHDTLISNVQRGFQRMPSSLEIIFMWWRCIRQGGMGVVVL